MVALRKYRKNDDGCSGRRDTKRGRVYFPTAFPNVCASVVPTRNEEPGNGAAMQPYNVDRTGFNLRVAGGGTVTLMYVAEGY